MNPQVRRLFLAIIFLMMLPLVAATSVHQVFNAPALNADSRNVRTVYREFNRDRGQIIVSGEAIASSTPVDDRFVYQRSYPHGPMYAHLTGYFSVINSSTTGLERLETDVLGGRSSSLWLQRVQAMFTGEQPQGGSVALTINPALQQAAVEALGGRRGAVVVTEPASGKVLAMVSSPSFDPNLLASHDTATVTSAWENLNNPAAHKPLINRAISGDLYHPGSVFKMITAAAMLSSGQYTPQTVLDSPDQLELPQTNIKLSNYGGAACGNDGKATLDEAFVQSCNTPFAAEAMKMGYEPLLAQAQAFGFDQGLSIPLSVTPSTLPEPPSQALLAMEAIGQWDTRVTPLQMAMVAAGIANKGSVMRPFLIDKELNANLEVVNTTPTSSISQAITPEVAAQLSEMMVNEVNRGTGKKVAIPGFQVAGKTGTAEGTVGEGPTTWFVGFAPAEAPRYAIAVVLDGGPDIPTNVTGGDVAAPVAKAILQAGVGG
ncbi:MAG: penicillin-binding protein 2 [Actinomycetaceae bacterium]|nr:penicillin-binding protein 2 [Actinomycetaceae bacterium]